MVVTLHNDVLFFAGFVQFPFSFPADTWSPIVMMIKKTAALAASLTLALAAAAGAARAAEDKVLNIYNWSDYIADDTIKNFEKETGIKVNYDNYDANEVLHAKLVAGKTGYDIVVPSAHFAKTQIEGGLFQKLDKSKLTNWGNLDKGILEQLAAVDPGNQYLVNWLWGYVTVGINVPKVKAALGSMPMPDNAWSLIFDPKYASKLKSCGINYLDSASEVLPVAMLYVGKPPYSKNPADYDAAAKMLAGDAAIANGKAGIQVHGGIGFTWEVDAQRFWKRAVVLDTHFGNSDEHAEAVAAML